MYLSETAGPAAAQARPWYAHRWPWLLMIGPLAVILAGIYTGWLAFAQPDALVVDDYYKQGKAINQDLRRDKAAVALKLTLELHYVPAAGRLNGRVLSDGQPVAGIVRVRLVHPTQPHKDMALEVQPDQRGVFSTALPVMESARWQVQVENQPRDWRLHGTWAWPQQPAMQIQADQAG